jgi:hypothetical protein
VNNASANVNSNNGERSCSDTKVSYNRYKANPSAESLSSAKAETHYRMVKGLVVKAKINLPKYLNSILALFIKSANLLNFLIERVFFKYEDMEIFGIELLILKILKLLN